MSEIPIVKLHATTSTSDELKLRFRESELPNHFTIAAYEQVAGRGQRGSSWIVEAGKNLTFSFLRYNHESVANPFDLTKFISVALVEWLRETFKIEAQIKWPNDILSDNKKIGGILIENFFRGQELSHSIIGIGLNVNQLSFDGLPNATSMRLIDNQERDLDQLLPVLMQWLVNGFKRFNELQANYVTLLAGYNEFRPYLASGNRITAKITGVTFDGKLELSLNDSSIKQYDLKEIEWVY